MSKKKEIITCLVASAIFVVLLALSIGLYFAFSGHKDTQKLTVDGEDYYAIRDEKSFLKALKNSATFKKNTIYYFDADNVKVSVDSLPKDRTDFYGILNGRGRTLTLVKGEGSSNLTQPVFNSVMRDAEIKQLNIAVEVAVSGEGVDSAAVLANSNYGKIYDCSVKVKDVIIGNDCKEASALVLRNFETISRVCLQIENVSSEIDKTEDWQCRFGSVAVVNYNTINNVLADVNFDTGLVIFDAGINNQYVGFVISGISNENEVKVENIFLFNSGVRFSMASDNYIFNGEGYNIVDNFGREIDSKLRDQNGWTETVWKFNGQSFPELVLSK